MKEMLYLCTLAASQVMPASNGQMCLKQRYDCTFASLPPHMPEVGMAIIYTLRFGKCGRFWDAISEMIVKYTIEKRHKRTNICKYSKESKLKWNKSKVKSN